MTATLTWRGPFTSAEANALHAETFGTRVFGDDEWDWVAQVERWSLGWVTARDADGGLVGFVNVLTDGEVHAWLQDVSVARSASRQGVGQSLVAAAASGAREAGCEWLHVDFEPQLAPFYLGACGFAPTAAGLLRLA